MAYSPITGIFGHRQVGKTTLCEKLSEAYVSFDLREQAEQAKAGPDSFLESRNTFPLALDEVQLVPEIFPALKDAVRRNHRPGQYLLTGSVRFSSRKAIRESMTGRIISWELLPFDLAESEGRTLPDFLLRLAKAKTLELRGPKPRNLLREIDRALITGSLPGIFAIRNSALRIQRFNTQLEALLERDLRLVLETTLPFSTLRRVASEIAVMQGQELEWSELKRRTRVSIPALKALLRAFEAMYMIRWVGSFGGIKKPVIYFEDQGEANHLAPRQTSLRAVDLQKFLFSNLRHQWIYRPNEQGSVAQYRTRGGAYIPLVYRSPKTTSLGILPIMESAPDPTAIGSATSLIRSYPGSKVLFVHPGMEDRLMNRSMRVLPASLLV